MSTSLNVVSIAAVFCASLSRFAMVWRRRVILTRSSLRSPAEAGVQAWLAQALVLTPLALSPRRLGPGLAARVNRAWACSPSALRRRQHVVLGQPAVLARALDLASGRHDARAPRGGPRATASSALSSLRLGCVLGAAKLRIFTRARRGWSTASAASSPATVRRAARRAAFFDPRDHRADGDRVALPRPAARPSRRRPATALRPLTLSVSRLAIGSSRRDRVARLLEPLRRASPR